MMKFSYLFMLLCMTYGTQAYSEILTLSVQTFKDSDGLIKQIPDYTNYPSAKAAYDKVAEHFQFIVPYQPCLKMNYPDTTDVEQIKILLPQCRAKMKKNCMETLKKCHDQQIQNCEAYEQCRKNEMAYYQDCSTNFILGTTQWIGEFYQSNKNLAQPFSGKMLSQDNTAVLFIENGVQKAAYPITDFGCAKVYDKNGQFYTLEQTPEHEEDQPFTGIRTIEHTQQDHADTYTLQKYAQGKADGPVYQETHKHHMVYKPIIYLYPEVETEVSIKVGHPEKFTHTYPKYADGWRVIAKPSGDLTDFKTNRHLYALYWEGNNAITKKVTEGFMVKGADTISFLEEKLALLGLNEREAEEFIIYWLPKLENNPYNLIHFESITQQNENMPLDITPKPDTLVRVLMEYKPLEDKIDLPEQTLPPTPTRTGFTVVEWGGTELKEKD